MTLARRRKFLGALAALAAAGRTPLAVCAPLRTASAQAASRYVPPAASDAAKVGQLLMVHIRYLADGKPQYMLDDPTRAMLADVQPGGVVLYASNIASRPQLAALLADVRAALRVPPFIAVDEEGGRVSRLQGLDGIVAVAPARELARQGMTAVKAAYERIGAELAALQINMDLAPVADLGLYPQARFLGDRAFAEDAATVSRAVTIAVEALAAHGVLAVVKHFPGHGRAREDSHRMSSVVTATRTELAEDLAPFRAAFAAGAAGLMTAHLAYPALDPSGALASLSAPILSGIARSELGFDGLIMTDALEMRGVSRRRGETDAAQSAFLAGADMLMGPTDPRAIRDQLLQSLDSARDEDADAQPPVGNARARLADSYARIMRTKDRHMILTASR